MSKSTQKWIEKCDDKFRELIRIRDRLTCQVTGLKRPVDELEVSHYVRRGNIMLRFEPNNACLVSLVVHRKTPEYKLRQWYRAKFPVRAAVMDRLKKIKFDISDNALEVKHRTLKLLIEQEKNSLEEQKKNIESFSM